MAIDISLTDFVDFVISSGTPKLTKVKTVKNRGDYHPSLDYWKKLRDGIVDYHKSGKSNKTELEKIMINVNQTSKKNLYQDRIDKYKSFLGRKQFVWFDPVFNRWGPPGIDIRVNPELGLKINGEQYLIKLYFKREQLSKRKIDLILLLMQDALQTNVTGGINYGVLDVQRSKLYSTNNADVNFLPLLIGEAVNFKTIWEKLG